MYYFSGETSEIDVNLSFVCFFLQKIIYLPIYFFTSLP